MASTFAVLAVVFAALIVYDIIIMVKLGGDATISWTLWTYAKKYPIIPFALGIICGHLFWVQNCGN